MNEIKYSKYQLAIFNEYDATNNSIVIQAGPGSGKSFTILQLLKRTPKFKKVILTAFNKSIADELKTKVPQNVRVSTIHSLGYSILRSHLPNNYSVKEYKTFIIAKKTLNYTKFNSEKEKTVYTAIISSIVDLVRLNLTTTKEQIRELCNEYNISILNGEVEDTMIVLDALDEYNSSKHKDFMIDFVDMLWLPYKYVDVNLYPKYDVLFVDESQDLNPLQGYIVDNVVKKTGRSVFVGDKNQCQPTGTKVMLWNGNEKNIEDLEIGDKVISYNTWATGGFVGYYGDAKKTKINRVLSDGKSKVNKIKKRYVKDESLIELKAGNRITRYTYNHKCMIRWRSDKIKAHALYLMQKGDKFRIGITPLWGNNSSQHSVTYRAKGEDCDKMWILNIYPTKYDAYLQEQYHSVKYGIPQMIFLNRGQNINLGQETLDLFYAMFDPQEQINNAVRLLTAFNKYLDCPFWIKGGKNYNSKLHMFQNYACNIFSDYMQVAFFDKDNKREKTAHNSSKVYMPKYTNIDNISIVKYSGFVYSLEINKYEKYVADGILTHNSIYSFMGANIKSFQYFIDKPNTTILPLSVTYRCPKSVARMASEIFPGIEPFEENSEGIIRYGKLNEVQEGDYLLCRNNLPLVEAWISFIKEGKKCHILGKDFGEQLLSMINKLSRYDSYLEGVEEILRKKINDLTESGVKSPTKHPSYQSLVEKIEIINILKVEFGSFEETKNRVEEIFSNEVGKGITLSTIHKAKGLENDRVFILGYYDLLPSKYAQTELELRQERCLQYVAVTRTKQELVFINL